MKEKFEYKVGDYIVLRYGVMRRDFYVARIDCDGYIYICRDCWRASHSFPMDIEELDSRDVEWLGPGIPSYEPKWWEFWITKPSHPFVNPYVGWEEDE